MADWRKIAEDRDKRPKVQEYNEWKELPPIPISFPDNAAPTGAWRTLRPILNVEKCTKCGFCWLYCPEGTIKHDPNSEYYIIDLDFCKGCGICAHECPTGAMTMKREEEAHKENGEDKK